MIEVSAPVPSGPVPSGLVPSAPFAGAAPAAAQAVLAAGISAEGALTNDFSAVLASASCPAAPHGTAQAADGVAPGPVMSAMAVPGKTGTSGKQTGKILPAGNLPVQREPAENLSAPRDQKASEDRAQADFQENPQAPNLLTPTMLPPALSARFSEVVPLEAPEKSSHSASSGPSSPATDTKTPGPVVAPPAHGSANAAQAPSGAVDFTSSQIPQGSGDPPGEPVQRSPEAALPQKKSSSSADVRPFATPAAIQSVPVPTAPARPIDTAPAPAPTIVTPPFVLDKRLQTQPADAVPVAAMPTGTGMAPSPLMPLEAPAAAVPGSLAPLPTTLASQGEPAATVAPAPAFRASPGATSEQDLQSSAPVAVSGPAPSAVHADALASPINAEPRSVSTPAAAASLETGAPHQSIASLVDRITEARAAAAPHIVRAALMHDDFGSVSLSFRAEERHIQVTMASADSSFAPAAQAAAAASLASAASREPEARDHSGAAQAHSQGEAPQDGQASQQQGTRDRSAAGERHPPREPAFGRASSAASERGQSQPAPPRRSGIYA